jgi:hypothetical protein
VAGGEGMVRKIFGWIFVFTTLFLININIISAATYRGYAEIVNKLKTLEDDNPNVAKIYDEIGTSYEGRKIIAIKISDNPGDEEDTERKVLFIGGHHAREWISVEVPSLLAEYLVDNYSKKQQIRDLVNNNEIWILPLLNPDGYEYSRTDNRLWRKNRRVLPLSPFCGVDLNRNYGFNFSDIEWIDQWGISYNYCGPDVFSEVETQAIKKLIEEHKFKTIISYHSWGQEIIYPANSPFKNIATQMEKLIESVNNKNYNVKQSDENGSLTSWAYYEKGIPSFTIELRPDKNFCGDSLTEKARCLLTKEFFKLPESEIVPTFEENLKAALYMLRLQKDGKVFTN